MPKKVAPITFKYLLNDDYFPLTSTVGFLETKDFEKAANQFLKWRNSINDKTSCTDVVGDFETALEALLPMYGWANKFLFVPTAGDWTAVFSNSFASRGSIEIEHVAYTRLSCVCVICAAIPDTRIGTYPNLQGRNYYTMLNITDPVNGEFPCYELRKILACDSSLMVSNWTFKEEGAALPFEKTQHYSAKKKKDRFTPELLDEYLRVYGIRAFDEDFYLPDGRAILVEARGKYTEYKDPKSLELYQIETEKFSPYAMRKKGES